MVKAFEFFDTDRSGYITVDELEEALLVSTLLHSIAGNPVLPLASVVPSNMLQ